MTRGRKLPGGHCSSMESGTCRCEVSYVAKDVSRQSVGAAAQRLLAASGTTHEERKKKLQDGITNRRDMDGLILEILSLS